MRLFNRNKEASPPKEKKKRMTKERAVRLLSSALVIAMVAGLFGNIAKADVDTTPNETGYIYFNIPTKAGDNAWGHWKSARITATYDGWYNDKKNYSWNYSNLRAHRTKWKLTSSDPDIKVTSSVTSTEDTAGAFRWLEFYITYPQPANYTLYSKKEIPSNLYSDKRESGENSDAITIESAPTGYVSANTTRTVKAIVNMSHFKICPRGETWYPYHGIVEELYIREKFTITFDSKGGSNVSSPIYRIYGEKIGVPSTSRKGYEFKGWRRTSDGAYLADNWTADRTETFEAQWEKKSKTFKFHTNGGTKVSDQTLNDPGSISAPNTTRSGNYVFKGWSENADGSGTKILAGENLTYSGDSDWGEVNLYAVWERKDANWNMENVVEDEDMFTNDEALEGEAGTTYDEEYTNSEYAHKDSADDPGYFSGK